MDVTYLSTGNFEKFVESLLTDPDVNKNDNLYKLGWTMDHIKKYSPAFAKLREEEKQSVQPENEAQNAGEVPSWF